MARAMMSVGRMITTPKLVSPPAEIQLQRRSSVSFRCNNNNNNNLKNPRNPNSVRCAAADVSSPYEPLELPTKRTPNGDLVMFYKKSVATIEVVLEDEDGDIWKELNHLQERLNSSVTSNSTKDVFLELMKFILIREKSSVYKGKQLFYSSWSVDKFLKRCDLEQKRFDLEKKRVDWRWWDWNKKKRNRIYLRVFAGCDEDIVEDVVTNAYIDYPDEFLWDHVNRMVQGSDSDEFGVVSFTAYAYVMSFFHPKLLFYATTKGQVDDIPDPHTITFVADP